MSDSLRDQLLKVGLVNEKQVKKAQQNKRIKHKKKKKTQSTPEAIDQNKQEIQQALEKKIAYDRDLNEKMREKIKRKEIAAQIKQLIEDHRLPKEEGDVAYNFVDGKKVKRMYVTPSTQEKLNQGHLAIAKLGDQYSLLPKTIAEKIQKRDAARVMLFNNPKVKAKAKDDEKEDPYADFQVPDDLMW